MPAARAAAGTQDARDVPIRTTVLNNPKLPTATARSTPKPLKRLTNERPFSILSTDLAE